DNRLIFLFGVRSALRTSTPLPFHVEDPDTPRKGSKRMAKVRLTDRPHLSCGNYKEAFANKEDLDSKIVKRWIDKASQKRKSEVIFDDEENVNRSQKRRL